MSECSYLFSPRWVLLNDVRYAWQVQDEKVQASQPVIMPTPLCLLKAQPPKFWSMTPFTMRN